MLRRKHKKMRNKRGGRTFMDAFTEGAGTIKKSTLLAKEKAERVGEGTKSGFIAFNAGRTAAINRNIIGGEDNFFDPFSTTGSNWLKKTRWRNSLVHIQVMAIIMKFTPDQPSQFYNQYQNKQKTQKNLKL
jgi:hypothetical protein